MTPFDRLCDSRVQARAARCSQLMLESRSQKCVSKGVAAGRFGELDNDRRLDGRVEHVEQSVIWEVAYEPEYVELELAAYQRRDLQDAASVLGVGARCVVRSRRVLPPGTPKVVRWCLLFEFAELLEVADELFHEERVAGRLVMDRLDQPAGSSIPRHVAMSDRQLRGV